MKDADYKSFLDNLFMVAPNAGKRPGEVDAFRAKNREEIATLLTMLHRIGVCGGVSELHSDPPGKCDSCGLTLAERAWFVDGQTSSGAWANMCPLCFYESGHSIGWGRGQLYMKLDKDTWRLIGGSNPNAREAVDAEGSEGEML